MAKPESATPESAARLQAVTMAAAADFGGKGCKAMEEGTRAGARPQPVAPSSTP